jgi:hypothetical protein
MSCLSGLENLKLNSGNGEFLGADAQEFVIPNGFDLEFADSDHGEGVFSTTRHKGHKLLIFNCDNHAFEFSKRKN